jgi:hypothetical protein
LDHSEVMNWIHSVYRFKVMIGHDDSTRAENNATTIHRQALPAPFEGWEAEFALVTMAPGPGYHRTGIRDLYWDTLSMASSGSDLKARLSAY